MKQLVDGGERLAKVKLYASIEFTYNRWELMGPFISSSISMVLQIAALFILIGSLLLKTKKKFRQHGATMLLAILLHTISISVVMIPSFVNGFAAQGAIDFGNLLVIIAFVHAIAGVIAELLGVWIIVSWRFQSSLRICSPRKNLMRYTLVLWLISLILGIVLYLEFYTTILPL